MTGSRLCVAVIGGGRSCEHDVSLASAASVAEALRPRHTVVPLTVGRDGVWAGDDGGRLDLPAAVTALQSCDVAVPVVHGPHGEDGTLAALCELADVPYVGSGVMAGAVAMDKWATKLVAAELGLGVAPGRLVTRAGAAAYVASWDAAAPVVVKPVAAGSSHGVSLARDRDGLERALTAALALDDRVLVEDVVVGREVDVAVLGRPDGRRVVAPALEVVCDGLFDHGTKYDGSADFRVPAPLPATQVAALEHAAVAMYDALGCRGVARIDFFVTGDGLVLNEVNTAPGFTAASQVPRMFAAAGTSYGDLVDLLVRDAIVSTRATAA